MTNPDQSYRLAPSRHSLPRKHVLTKPTRRTAFSNPKTQFQSEFGNRKLAIFSVVQSHNQTKPCKETKRTRARVHCGMQILTPITFGSLRLCVFIQFIPAPNEPVPRPPCARCWLRHVHGW